MIGNNNTPLKSHLLGTFIASAEKYNVSSSVIYDYIQTVPAADVFCIIE